MKKINIKPTYRFIKRQNKRTIVLATILILVVLCLSSVAFYIVKKKSDKASNTNISSKIEDLRGKTSCVEGLKKVETSDLEKLNKDDKVALLNYRIDCNTVIKNYDLAIKNAEMLKNLYSADSSTPPLVTQDIDNKISDLRNSSDSEKTDREYEEKSHDGDDGYDGPYL